MSNHPPLMTWETFRDLAPQQIEALLKERYPDGLQVAMPLNGTRRWFLAESSTNPALLYDDNSDSYVQYTRDAMLRVLATLFEDGVHAVAMPVIGYDLVQRGEDYMTVAYEGLAALADQGALAWGKRYNVRASVYGELTTIHDQSVYTALTELHQAGPASPDHYVAYGVFADHALRDLLPRVIQLTQEHQQAPTESMLCEEYYHAPIHTANLWIGTDQPSVFDVPMVIDRQTALYFLQFPTPYLDRQQWRRILYDYLFVRDQLAVSADQLDQPAIWGLGKRTNLYWELDRV